LLGEAKLAQGQLEEGRQSLVSAVELARAQGARLYEHRAAASLATLGPMRADLAEHVMPAR
jgi:hypothetical protein